RRALRDLHPDVAGKLPTLATLAAHRLQAAHTPFVAGAARLDALPDPGFLLRQQLVEARTFLRLRIQPLFAAALVIGPVARPARHLAAVDLDDAGGQRAQEATVVGDEHECALP